jgi:protein-L-isoaspartate(D-aspartate) O-methyltransferase
MNCGEDGRTGELRSFFAKLVTAGVPQNERLLAAFGAIPREKFVGPGPWKVATAADYIETPSSDQAYLYQNVVIALSAEEGVNNGEPGAHARWIAALNVTEGERILHVGAGTGYYTAILAHLAGPEGRVIAYEVDQGRAMAAKANLAGVPTVRVEHRSGSEGPLPTANAIYVNAGATHPLSIWLDALEPRGRLLFPLTHGRQKNPHLQLVVPGGMLLVSKTMSGEFAAKFVSPASFIGCIGARDDAASEGLAAAFRAGKLWSVKSLRRDGEPDESCWYAGSGWWLSTAPPKPAELRS